LINRLHRKNLEPYKGFTSDGKVRDGLYQYAEDEGAPTEQVVKRVEGLLELLDGEQRKEVHCGEVTDDEFRLWSNPELYVNPGMSSLTHEVSETSADMFGRRTPSRRMHLRNSNWYPCHPQGVLLSSRIR
jgi:hypothetical protein